MSKKGIFLNDVGKAAFNRIKSHCEANKILFEIDDMAIENLAFWMMVVYDNSQHYATNGFIQKTKSGYGQVSPEYALTVRAQEMVAKLSPPFGLTPGDRERIFSGMKKDKEKKKGFNLK